MKIWLDLWDSIFKAIAGAVAKPQTTGDPLFSASTVQHIEETGYSREAEENGQRRRLVEFCRSQKGKGYLLGVEVQPGQEYNTNLWDCSEEDEAAFRLEGMPFPDGAQAQYDFCRPVPAPKPGDLFFLWSDTRKCIGHVGMYTGEGTVVHAVKGRGVVEDPVGMWETHVRFRGWRRHPDFARSPEERGNHV